MKKVLKDKAIAVVTAAALTVTASPFIIDKIKVWEGFSNTAYPDPALGWGVPTICYGHTGPEVVKGLHLPQSTCVEILLVDVEKHCNIVYTALIGTGVRLTQGEQDAYCSFAMNTGLFKYYRGNTTTIYRELMKGNHYAACEGLLLYNRSGGKVLSGLVKRRSEEYQICVSGLPRK